MTAEEIQSLSKASNDVIEKLDKPYTWVQSYITGDKMYCIHIAESEASDAKFYFLKGLSFDNSGNLFVADLNRVFKITPKGVVSTFINNSVQAYPGKISKSIKLSQIEDMVMDREEKYQRLPRSGRHYDHCSGWKMGKGGKITALSPVAD